MIPYTLQASIILAGCLIFYKILLQRETFYRLNRFVLLICLALSFSLPLIPVPAQFSFRKTEISPANDDINLKVATTKEVEKTIQSIPAKSAEPVKLSIRPITFEQVSEAIFWLYWFGVVAFAINFLVQVISLLYRAYSSPVIIDGKFRIVELSGDKAPCSFGNNIFINPEKYDWETYNQILLHEKIHIEQGHTMDILLAEIVLVFQWFNPFAWQYRKELENNLEFLTDDQLLQHNNVEKTSYQLSLLKVSAPHFPLSLTTNYNQSLLKKRLVMMNTKKSNVHTTWKYLFMLPLLVLFVCLLNEPVVVAQDTAKKNPIKKNNSERNISTDGIDTEGSWFATIKGDKISIHFKNTNDDHSSNSNSFLLSEFKDLPRDKSGSFQLVRDAGTFQFNGKFEGNEGMGTYKFVGDKSFVTFLLNEGIEGNTEQDLMVYALVDVTKAYIQELKSNGYTKLEKNKLIPLAALKVDGAYIKSLKSAGFPEISLDDLVPFKALGIDSDFIDDIRKAGYKNVSTNQLISLKAQGIDGKYIADIRSATKVNGKDKEAGEDKDDAEDIVAIKALNVDAAYIQSLKEAGYTNLSNQDLVAMKAQGITADYIKRLQAMGFKDISASNLIAVKAQDITQEYVKSLQAVGYNNIDIDELIPVKALGVSPDYIRSFQQAGYKNLPLEQFVALKAQGITINTINEYKDLGFDNLSLDDVISAKATGTTPAFVKSMRQKGHNMKSLQKYLQLKVAVD